MKRWLSLSLLLVLLYAALLGYFSWRAFFLYVRPDYRSQLRWETPWISPPRSSLNQAYFRKTIYLKDRPAHAWLAVMAPDRFTLFLNGQRVGNGTYLSGYAQQVFDITGYLGPGRNVIAIRNAIGTYRQQVRIAVQGRYVGWNGESFNIQSDASWRTAERNESLISQGGMVQPTPWFAPAFDDGHFPYVVEGTAPRETITSRLSSPPSLITEPLHGQWIWAENSTAPEAYFRLELSLPERPRDAWLRIRALRDYRLLVNGYLVAIREENIGTAASGQGPFRFYNLSPFLQGGRNVVAVQASNSWTDRGLLVDGFVEGWNRKAMWFSATQWKASETAVERWEAPDFDDSRWRPAAVVKAVSPMDLSSRDEAVSTTERTLSFRLKSLAIASAVLSAILIACLAVWAFSAKVLAALTREAPYVVARWLPVTFLPPALLLGIAYLLGYDARLSFSFSYQPRVIAASVALLLLLHVTLIGAAALSAKGFTLRSSMPGNEWRKRLTALRAIDPGLLLAMGLAALGFGLRLKDSTYEPLGGDEVSAVMSALGVLARGYPSVVVDGSVKIALTSELVGYVKAPGVWLFGANAFGLRFTDVILGTLAILVLYWVGRLLHGRRVGLLAAAWYAILPPTILMTHYARYPSQLQFFALLTFGFLFRAVGQDRIRPLPYYLAIAAFIATYLSWEGCVFYLPSLVIGVMFLTRPNFGWMKNGHVWTGIGIIAMLIFFQLSHRFITQGERQIYGTGTREAGLALAWQDPFFEPAFYIHNFFLLENHLLLTLLFVLAAPLWFLRSREGRILGFIAVTLLVDLFLMTNFLALHAWRYVYFLLPLLILSASMAVVIFAGYLSTLCRSVQAIGNVVRGMSHATAGVMVGVVLLFSTTFVVKLYDPPWSAYAINTRLGVRSFGTMDGAADYIREHFLPGDIVIAVNPHVMQFYLGRADYFLQSQLRLPLLLRSDPGLAIHRAAGVPTILSANELKEILSRSTRAWLVSYGPEPPAVDEDIATLLTRNIRIVYEDFGVTLYLLGGRPAAAGG